MRLIINVARIHAGKRGAVAFAKQGASAQKATSHEAHPCQPPEWSAGRMRTLMPMSSHAEDSNVSASDVASLAPVLGTPLGTREWPAPPPLLAAYAPPSLIAARRSVTSTGG